MLAMAQRGARELAPQSPAMNRKTQIVARATTRQCLRLGKITHYLSYG
jgi:hypothetical protein